MSNIYIYKYFTNYTIKIINVYQESIVIQRAQTICDKSRVSPKDRHVVLSFLLMLLSPLTIDSLFLFILYVMAFFHLCNVIDLLI